MTATNATRSVTVEVKEEEEGIEMASASGVVHRYGNEDSIIDRATRALKEGML